MDNIEKIDAAPYKRRSRVLFPTIICVVLGTSVWITIRYIWPLAKLGYVDSAIGTLRTLVTAEEVFAKKHPARGYSCAFSDLDSDAMLRALAKSGNRNGYAFDLVCPAKDRDGIQRAYKVTARPLHTNMPAYCSDQSGVLRYDEKGSPSDCLQNGIPF
jgi:hypothetical protein